MRGLGGVFVAWAGCALPLGASRPRSASARCVAFPRGWWTFKAPFAPSAPPQLAPWATRRP
eukprot:14278808-Alexandrium_andersonii.AAC.1